MRVIGLSGGIASGKSTVSLLLASEGLTIIDCDVIAHHVSEKGKWGYRRIKSAFGSSVLLPSGEIDRAALARLVFKDAAARRKLNRATHLPVALEVIKRILWCWLICKWVVVLDMPLLFETGFHRFTSLNVLIACSPQIQVERLIRRDRLTYEDAQARISAQMPLEAKQQMAQIVIDNEENLEGLQQQARWLRKRLRRQAGLLDLVLSPIGLAIIGISVWRIF